MRSDFQFTELPNYQILPMIVLMAGLPASGKSTLCRELAMRLRGIVLDKDEIRAALFAPGDIEYSTAQDDFCVNVLLQAASFILGKNPERFIFLDGRPFSRAYQVDQVVQFAESKKQKWRILECVGSEETARQRLGTQETHPAANRNFELYLRIRHDFEEIRQPKIAIDTDQPLETCVQQALKAISACRAEI